MGVVAARLLALLSVFLFSAASLAQTAVQTLITSPIDEGQLTVLKGNTHPLARAEFDQGAAPADLPMSRMLLVLKRSPEQESALRTLLDDQQDKASPSYHKWLTPEDFGKQFGPSDQDIQQVTTWLRAHGFQIAQVSKGRTVIEFSGTAAQVQEALHTSIHKYAVNGEQHWANASDPQIPTALTPVVAGVLTLHNFLKEPQIHIAEQKIAAKYVLGEKPQFTASNGLHALSPADYYTIYNISPQMTGFPAQIAIVGRSNINGQDILYFRDIMNVQGFSPNVLINGSDPGDLGGAEEAEATLDTAWSDAVSPNSIVNLVVSASTNSTDGVDLSEVYIIDNNLADVMSESFGDCEADETSADASAIASLAQQAAAQGITYLVSSGDSGAAGCDDPNTENVARRPPSVNILASTPYTIAVGGTMFNENGQDSTYWGATNSEFLGSAQSYIPEKVWNEPSIWASGGGASVFFQKPTWQAGFGDSARDVPDVSLTAASHDPYLLCLDGSCIPDSQRLIHFAAVGGTSASTPAFAGIMAQVGQKTGSRQGQANYVLYRLASTETFSQCNGSKPGGIQVSTCVFNDITLGNNSVPGDADFGTSSAKYQSSMGYDLATGLGSVNVGNLLNAWGTVMFHATTTTASISPVTAIHGAAINLNVQVAANSGTPSGVIWLQGGPQRGNLIGDNTTAIFTLDSSGSLNTTTHVLLGGFYQINVHYAGDGTYAPSDSAPPVNVSIQAEPSTTTLSVFTVDQSANLIPFTGGAYGTPVYLKAHVAGKSGYGVPTAYVNFYDTAATSDVSSADVNNNGDAVPPPISSLPVGQQALYAGYYGDSSFNSSTSTSLPVAITQAATTTVMSTASASQGVTFNATVSANGGGNSPTGVVTFYSGPTALGNAQVSGGINPPSGAAQATATFTDTQLANGQYSISATYSGDTNYLLSTSSPVSISLQPDFSLSPLGSSSLTVVPGQSGALQLTVNYSDGFSGTVTFSCSGLPSESACITSPLSSAGIAAFRITTTAPVSASLKAKPRGPALWATTFGASFASILLLGIPRRRRAAIAFLSLLVVAVLFMGIGCGGGSGSSSVAGPPSNPGTPAGTYSVLITATSGTLSHTMTFTLIVE